MHGRLKVKTTAEQEETKRKEREKKLQIYKAGTANIFTKREKGEFDPTLLSLTGELLSANPDFYTLWNIRREVFTHVKQNEAQDMDPADLQSYLNSELQFLEQCLRVNPKSYGTWNHRGWVMTFMPEPDWARELMLCNKFLEYDERNFHCWDYRRFVVQHSGVSTEDELAYTTSKIESNFSNYSSWHYRSKLLPLTNNDEKTKGRLNPEQHVNECMLAQNAFFTDPSDQSAWFYHRWLLGRVEHPLRIECIHICKRQWRLVVGLSQTIQLTDDLRLEVYCGEDILPVTWQSPTGEQFSKVWVVDNMTQLESIGMTLSVVIREGQCEVSRQEVTMVQGHETAMWRHLYKPGARFCQELSAVTSDVLTQELDSLQQLHDLEPDNKWVLLTILSVMRALDPLKHAADTDEYINKLIEGDPMRTNYYKDLKSKCTVENTLEETPSDAKSLDLSNKGLTEYSHAEHMVSMETIDLSGNDLTSLKDGHLLQCVKCLKLDGNSFSSCERLSNLGALEELSLNSNNISSLSDLTPLMSCPNLKKLYLKDNPICTSQVAVTTITNLEVIC